MSFFSSLQQYVTSGVAGLGLSPRRFSFPRQESADGSTLSHTSGGSTQQTNASSGGTTPSAGDKPAGTTPVHGE